MSQMLRVGDKFAEWVRREAGRQRLTGAQFTDMLAKGRVIKWSRRSRFGDIMKDPVALRACLDHLTNLIAHNQRKESHHDRSNRATED